jgi:hypothetical protein
MGIFDSLTGAQKGFFVIRGQGDKRLSPEQYGHWLFRWSLESGFKFLTEIKNGDCTPSPMATEIRSNGRLQYLVVFQFSAIFASAYWYYASNILKVGLDTQDRMRVGLDDGIQSSRIDGEPIDLFWTQLFRGALAKYLKANISDGIDGMANSDAFNPDVSAIAKAFFEIHEKYFPEIKVTGIDRSIIGNYVADMPVNLLIALKDEIGLVFVQP